MRRKKNLGLKYEREKNVIRCANTPIINLEKELGCLIGVKPTERLKRQEKYGKNQVVTKKFNHFKKIFQALIEPFNLLLLFIGLGELIIYFFYSQSELLDLISAAIIFFMIILAGGVNYFQDYRAFLANLELHHLVENEFPVYPDHLKTFSIEKNLFAFRKKLVRIDQSSLTIGDLIYLEAGDVIPADVRIIFQKEFLVNESSLTGESEAVLKKTSNKNPEMINLENIAFAQTTAIKGFCVGVVINVGTQNYASAILKMAEEQNVSGDYEKGLTKITKLLVLTILGMIPIILIASGLRTSDWIRALTFALTIAVSLTPEALPAIISSNLQLGSKKLAKEKVVVKNLSVVQNMGSVNILCTDKTGTLTNEEVSLSFWQDYRGQQTDFLARLIYLNAVYQQNISNKMDRGILKLLNEKFLDNRKYIVLNEEAFNHESRSSTILLKNNHQTFQITKGSVEETLTKISWIRDGDRIIKATKNDLQKLNQQIIDYAQQGFRALVVASVWNKKQIVNTDFVYEGFALFEEEIKPGVKEAIQAIYDYNIDLKILTGDDSSIAKKIAKTLKMHQVTVAKSSEINALDEKEMCSALKTTNVLTKLSPIDKALIINHLKETDKSVIAFLGDGVNDAVALKTADVGISVNNGTPLAKAAAAIILLEKDLGVLEKSFVKGREIFTNAIKYINITVAANFGLMITLLISALWFDFSAMTPLQLLLQNLIYDFANLIFVFDKVDDYSIKKPLKWNVKSIVYFAFWNGLVATLISISNFLIVGYGFGLFSKIESNNKLAIANFQTMFFLESMITHMVLILVYRTERISLVQSFPSWQLVLGMLFFLTIAFMITYIHQIANILKFEQPNNWWLLVMLGLVGMTWILGEGTKFSYKKVFKHWF